jgi:hypothetical protein
MSEPTFVYVVEGGEYEDKYLSGIFSTPEKAIEAFPVTRQPRLAGERAGGWKEEFGAIGGTVWHNGLDSSAGGLWMTRHVVDYVWRAQDE